MAAFQVGVKWKEYKKLGCMCTTFVQGLFMVDSLLLELEVIVSLCSRMVMSQGENMGLEREMIVTVKKGMWSDELWFL